jgi:prepilin-type N-terminal cleavage/methylation domain-containing protein
VAHGDRVDGATSDDQLGFTLIELLIVIVVLGILAAVVVFALSGTGAQSASAACNADAKTVDVAVAAYDAQTGYSGSGTTPPAPTAALLVPTYLRSFPSSNLYTIGLTSTGVVTVQAPPSASAVPYNTNNTCGALSTNSGSSTSVSSPTTVAPTTVAPTTVAPTTVAPTTVAPTTVAPTTVAPTTVAPTTTTAVSNGVTATPSVPSNSNPYGAQEELSLTNTSSITALSITVTVNQTGGLAETQQYNSFPSGVTNGNSTSGSAITYTFVLTSGTIPAGYNGGNVYAQFSDNGIAHPTSGDLWSVTSTSGAVTSTLTGHF